MKKTTNPTWIGMDLGDTTHEVCVLNQAGEVAREEQIPNRVEHMVQLSKRYPGAVIIMEVGGQSPWVSRKLEELGHTVIVANARKVRAIYESDNKTDARDAEMLARIGRFDPRLLYGISHMSEQHQRALVILKSRDALMGARTKLINSTRGMLKSLGVQLQSGWNADAFARKAFDFMQGEDLQMVEALLCQIQHLTDQLKRLDKQVAEKIREDYPEAFRLQQIPGVGPITALAFVLIIGTPERFTKARQVGPFLGLVPKRDQSGESDKPLRITKAGSPMMRRLLVNCAQYMLGAFGPPSALRDKGERIAKGGGKVSKRKAVVATARQVAVVMLRIWKDPEAVYEPFPTAAALVRT